MGLVWWVGMAKEELPVETEALEPLVGWAWMGNTSFSAPNASCRAEGTDHFRMNPRHEFVHQGDELSPRRDLVGRAL